MFIVCGSWRWFVYSVLCLVIAPPPRLTAGLKTLTSLLKKMKMIFHTQVSKSSQTVWGGGEVGDMCTVVCYGWPVFFPLLQFVCRHMIWSSLCVMNQLSHLTATQPSSRRWRGISRKPQGPTLLTGGRFVASATGWDWEWGCWNLLGFCGYPKPLSLGSCHNPTKSETYSFSVA